MDVDFAVSTHVSVDPDENFEQASLALIWDGQTYVLVNLGFCEFCVGKAFYLEAYNNGASVLEGLQALPVGDDVNDVWIRIEHSPSGDATVVYVATKEGEWERLGPVIRGIPTGALAIGAASIPGPGSNPDEDLVARFDWVEVEVYD